ncbi:MAG: response regulator transcription factor, partial [Rectinemataceae bacterium]
SSAARGHPGGNMRILVADDEAKIVELVSRYLLASGFEVVTARDGKRALDAARTRAPDCAVLDIGLPEMDGLDLAREIRRFSEMPIIFLTARADEMDRVLGLELGADDYVTKPFSPRELVARVKSVLRRSARASSGGSGGALGAVLSVGSLRLDPDRRELKVDGKPVVLTAAQFAIMELLMHSPGRVFSRQEILEAASGSTFEGYERTVDAHVKNIRKAIGDDGASPRFIGTVRGVGYKLLETAGET